MSQSKKQHISINNNPFSTTGAIGRIMYLINSLLTAGVTLGMGFGGFMIGGGIKVDNPIVNFFIWAAFVLAGVLPGLYLSIKNDCKRCTDVTGEETKDSGRFWTFFWLRFLPIMLIKIVPIIAGILALVNLITYTVLTFWPGTITNKKGVERLEKGIGAVASVGFAAGMKATEEGLKLKEQAGNALKKKIQDIANENKPVSSKADEITKLRNLKDEGILSDEEFQSEKEKLLAS